MAMLPLMRSSSALVGIFIGIMGNSIRDCRLRFGVAGLGTFLLSTIKMGVSSVWVIDTSIIKERS